MSLHLLQETTPISYELCEAGDGTIYHPDLCTPPRLYREELNSSTGIWGFWYDANEDKYVLLSIMDFAAWPSWRINSWDIDPVTGVETVAIRDRSVAGLFFLRSYEAGDFNKVYAMSVITNEVKAIDPVTMLTVDPIIYNQSLLTPPAFSQKFVIARGVNTTFLSTTATFNNYLINTGVLQGQLAMPGLTAQDMAYEDNQRCWATLSNPDGGTTLVKVNYDTMKYEIMTKLQPGASPDINTGVAYDSKRKNLAVFRQRAANVDGSAAHVLDIHKPFSVSTNLTEPVPVGELIPGQVTTFIAHLYGGGGEVGQIRTVSVTNTGDGTILQPTVTPASNGAVSAQYLAGPNPGSDTIQFQVEI